MTAVVPSSFEQPTPPGNPEIFAGYGEVYGRYLELDKQFGTVDPKELLDVAGHIETNSELPAAHRVAASCLVEAAIWYPDIDGDKVDARLGLIDIAAEHLGTAARQYYTELTEGRRHPNDQADFLRTTVEQDFLQVYRDLVCREVTEATRGEIKHSLSATARTAHKLIASSRYVYDGAARAGLTGYVNELAAMYGVWETESRFLAIPATPRADNGILTREGSHDVILLEMEKNRGRDEIAGIQSIEIKRVKRWLDNVDNQYGSSRVISMNKRQRRQEVEDLFAGETSRHQKRRRQVLRRRSNEITGQ